MTITKKIVQTYAKSLFQNVQNFQPVDEKRYIVRENVMSVLGKIEETVFRPDIFIVGEELILLRSTIFSSKKLVQYLQNPTYSEKQKLQLILTIFPGLTVPLKAFLKVLMERNQLSLLTEIAEEYSQILLEFKNCMKVKIITSTFLQNDYGALLLQTLKKLTGANSILLDVSYNPKLLGGFIIEYKSTIIDLSLLKEFSLFFNEM